MESERFFTTPIKNNTMTMYMSYVLMDGVG